MTAQGIALSVFGSDCKAAVNTKAAKNSNNDFKEIFNVKSNNQDENLVSDGKNGNTIAKADVKPNNTSIEDNRITLSNSKSDDDSEVLDMSEINPEVMAMLAQTFGMNQNDLQELMNQMGIDVSELVFEVDPQSGEVSIGNSDVMKELIMGVHGIEDATAFLTNDTLSSELTEITQGVEEIVSQVTGLDKDAVNELLAKGFEEVMKDVAADDIVPLEEPKTDMKNQPQTMNEQSTPNNENNMSSSITNDNSRDTNNNEQGFNSDSSNANTNQSKSVEVITKTISDVEPDADVNQNPMTQFINKLDEAIQVNNTTEVQPMNRIVEQIVTQVRIRVLPETTNMELTLNPESLGKVNISVSNTNGSTTATLTVQNQVAKEAIEGQIQTLRETFEDKGIKVDAVEVNVSEFGFQKEHDDSEGQQNNSKKGNRNKRFRMGNIAGMSEQDDSEELQSNEEIKDPNSVIDYTA